MANSLFVKYRIAVTNKHFRHNGIDQYSKIHFTKNPAYTRYTRHQTRQLHQEWSHPPTTKLSLWTLQHIMTNACIKHEWNASFAAINISTKYGRARRSGTELTNGPKKPLSIIYLFRFCRVFGAILKYKHEQWHFVVERKKGVQKFISTAFADNGRRGGESWKKSINECGWQSETFWEHLRTWR